MRIIMVEDEAPARLKLRAQLAKIDDIELIAEATSGEEAIALIEELCPDLVLLDISMPILSGLDVLDTLTHQPYIIFTTAYSEHALDAFKYRVIDYLLKPFPLSRLIQAIEKAREQIQLVDAHHDKNELVASAYLRRLVSKKDDRMTFIALQEVIYIEARDGGTWAHTEQGVKPLSQTMDTLEQSLDPDVFVRMHRGYVINLDKVHEIQRYIGGKLAVIMEGIKGEPLISSRAGAERLKRFTS